MGIDYGRGITNIDTKTGIRYGVISMNEVTQAWCDSSEGVYLPIEVEENESVDPIAHQVDDGEYFATQDYDDTDIFIERSPFFTECGFCSPCAPGAGYLMTRADDCKAYCFSHDWFESGKAPYRVFKVSDGSEVFPTTEGADK